MPLHLTWVDLAIRLGLAALAGLAIGLDRELRGHPAGLRTMLLVTMAAALAMAQANLLLAGMPDLQGQGVRLDFMRLALGVLTGVGFIGGGAILRRGDMVTGLTTAACLWFATVLGLCFGGGQIGLGLGGTVVALVALYVFHDIERRLSRQRRGRLLVEAGPGFDWATLSGEIDAGHFRIRASSMARQRVAPQQIMKAELVYRASDTGAAAPRRLVDRLLAYPEVLRAEWSENGLERDD